MHDAGLGPWAWLIDTATLLSGTLIEKSSIRALPGRFAPIVAALLSVGLFASLGFWQIDRAAQKAARRAAFSDDGAYDAVVAGQKVRQFQRLESQGRYLHDRQFLIDNMVMGDRLGYFVITPFQFDRDGPLLLVNRGWIRKPPDRVELPAPGVNSGAIVVRGLAGKLPRVGIRSRESAPDPGSWPKVVLYPTRDEMARDLEREVLPFVLLLNPEPDSGFVRRWQPDEPGPLKHYAYALQWFAMSIAVVIVLGWQARKKIRPRASAR